MKERIVSHYEGGLEPYESLYKLNIGNSLDEFSSKEAMLKILKENDVQKRINLLTMLLNGIMVKGPSVAEVDGLLQASFSLDNIVEQNKCKIKLPLNERIIGVAGSGKKGVKTINISTPASILASSCGVYIAKACSCSTSSKTGSSDFLNIIGIDLGIPFDRKISILEDKKIAFFSIEATTPKFAEVYGGIFYAPHAMSFALAGLSLPIQVDVLAYGLSHPNVKLSVDIYKKYGFDNVFVYSSTEDGIHYLDEFITSGKTNIIGIKDGKIGRQVLIDVKKELGLDPQYNLEQIGEKRDVYENVIKSLMALKGIGESACIDTICVNAGVLIYLSRKVKNLKEGYDMAFHNIKSGRAFEHLLNIVELYGGNREKILRLVEENGSR